jgi:hypothetical protein
MPAADLSRQSSHALKTLRFVSPKGGRQTMHSLHPRRCAPYLQLRVIFHGGWFADAYVAGHALASAIDQKQAQPSQPRAAGARHRSPQPAACAQSGQPGRAGAASLVWGKLSWRIDKRTCGQA